MLNRGVFSVRKRSLGSYRFAPDTSCAAHTQRASAIPIRRSLAITIPRRARTAVSFARVLFQFREQRERLHRRHRVDVEAAKPSMDRILSLRLRLEESHLAVGGVAAAERRAPAARQLVALEAVQDFARTRDDRRRQPGQPRDLDPVAAVRAPGYDLAQEDDVVFPLADDDVKVGDSGYRIREVGQLVIVRSEDRIRTRTPVR